MATMGEFQVEVQYHQQQHIPSLVVVASRGLSLLGRNWLWHVQLDWKAIGLVTKDHGQIQVQDLNHKYKSMFAGTGGTMHNFGASLKLKECATAVFKKPRPVLFVPKWTRSFREIRNPRKVATINWAAPIVLVPKSNGQLRLCGDYKVTIHLHLKVDEYPLPKLEDLFTTLVGGQHFTKLDLRHTFQQI